MTATDHVLDARRRPHAAGRLFLVVGPSGAGKDRLIAEAGARLTGALHVARRHITRPMTDLHERHLPVSIETFEATRRAGGYLLHWRAHGCSYGIPAACHDRLLGGVDVIANVSRTVIEDARLLYPATRVLFVTAPAPVLAARLARRGRDADIAARLQRAALPVEADATIANDGAFEQALDRFLDALAPEETGIRF
jgi:ribose 1,5-bisphosphokinase